VLWGKEPAGLITGGFRDWLEVTVISKGRECKYSDMLTASCSLTRRNKKLKHVLSTIVQMLDVITSFNCNYYSPNDVLKK
jgi:hypothetical protein